MLLKRGIKHSSVKTLVFQAKNDEKTGKGCQKNGNGWVEEGIWGRSPKKLATFED